MEIGNSKSSKNIPFPSSFQVTFLQFPYSWWLWYRPAKYGKQFDTVIMKCHKICQIECLKTPLSIAHIVSDHCQSSFYWFYFKTFRQLKKKHSSLPYKSPGHLSAGEKLSGRGVVAESSVWITIIPVIFFEFLNCWTVSLHRWFKIHILENSNEI